MNENLGTDFFTVLSFRELPYNEHFAIMNDPIVSGGGVTKFPAAHPYNEHFPEYSAKRIRNIASESHGKGINCSRAFCARRYYSGVQCYCTVELIKDKINGRLVSPILFTLLL